MEMWRGRENPCHTSTCLQTSAAKGNLNISEDPFPVDHDKMHKEVWCGHPLFARLLAVRIRVQAKSLHLFSTSAFQIPLLSKSSCCGRSWRTQRIESDTPTYGVFYIRSPFLGDGVLHILLQVYILELNPQGDKLLKPSSVIYSTLHHASLCSSWLTDLFLRLTKL